MSITSFTKTQTGYGTWLVTAVSNLADATFYWWRDGVFAGASKSGVRSFTVETGNPQISVFDSSAESPEYAFPNFLRITWEWDGISDKYFVSSDSLGFQFWIDVGTRRNFVINTPAIADNTATDIGILSYKNGSPGATRNIAYTTVCIPNAPTLVLDEYDPDTNILTVEVS